jgi:hypothetical protein
VNIKVFIIATMFAVVENAYFGWNLTPKSDAELICDGIAMVMYALAFLRSGDPT